jgi:hypothetical protein
MTAHHGRRAAFLLVTACLAAAPSTASARLSLDDARQIALTKVERMEHKLKSEGAKDSSVPGCWRDSASAVSCLGMVSGKDSFLRWKCAVPMKIRQRKSASASRHRVAVKFTDPMCSF